MSVSKLLRVAKIITFVFNVSKYFLMVIKLPYTKQNIKGIPAVPIIAKALVKLMI